MNHPPSGAAARRRRVLAIAPFPPRLDGRHGGSRVVARLLEGVARRHDVRLLCLVRPEESTVDDGLRAVLVDVHAVPLPPANHRARELVADYAGLLTGLPTWARALRVDAFRRRLLEIAELWQPDVVHVEFAVMAQYLSSLPPGPGRVLVEHEVGVRAAADAHARAAGVARVRAAAELRAWTRYESRVLAQADAVMVFTPEDATAARALGASQVAVVPVGVDARSAPLDPVGATPVRLLFVGSFTHPPNVEAALRLVHDILPRVKRAVPEVLVDIVGHAPSERVMRLAGSGVSVAADVPDVTPYLDRAAVFVAPLRLGGGARVKVLEALAAGKAVVASPRALEGISVPSDAVVAADSDEALADAVIGLLRDPERRQAIAEAGHRWAQLHATWDSSAAALERVYTSVEVSGRCV